MSEELKANQQDPGLEHVLIDTVQFHSLAAAKGPAKLSNHTHRVRDGLAV